jgi:hypothetical protein
MLCMSEFDFESASFSALASFAFAKIQDACVTVWIIEKIKKIQPTSSKLKPKERIPAIVKSRISSPFTFNVMLMLYVVIY